MPNEVSLSVINKILLLGLTLLFWPELSLGKVLIYSVPNQNNQWEVAEGMLGSEQNLGIRNDFNLNKLALTTLTGNKIPEATPLLDESTINSLDLIAAAIDQEPKDAELIIEQGRAITFDPGQTGQALDVYQLRQDLLSGQELINLPVFVTAPAVVLEQTNSSGIRELVASGESNFAGSPQNRIHNIAAGAAKFNGVIIAPGEEFSFNKFLGEVDGEHGFLPELVIKPVGLIPEFGGGLCQVSTTTFRAAMNAGLPILERRNHSFAVRYYAPQGTDATIYPGSSDLRFRNNLTSDLLIWTRIVGNKLYFDFYGTKDNRQVAFDGPYQYDKKDDGSMKAVWTRTVILNNQSTTQVFKSAYLPPSLFPKISAFQPAP